MQRMRSGNENFKRVAGVEQSPSQVLAPPAHDRLPCACVTCGRWVNHVERIHTDAGLFHDRIECLSGEEYEALVARYACRCEPQNGRGEGGAHLEQTLKDAVSDASIGAPLPPAPTEQEWVEHLDEEHQAWGEGNSARALGLASETPLKSVAPTATPSPRPIVFETVGPHVVATRYPIDRKASLRGFCE